MRLPYSSQTCTTDDGDAGGYDDGDDDDDADDDADDDDDGDDGADDGDDDDYDDGDGEKPPMANPGTWPLFCYS
eukprot:3353059-Karenia_brevis.AAC.1